MKGKWLAAVINMLTSGFIEQLSIKKERLATLGSHEDEAMAFLFELMGTGLAGER